LPRPSVQARLEFNNKQEGERVMTASQIFLRIKRTKTISELKKEYKNLFSEFQKVENKLKPRVKKEWQQVWSQIRSLDLKNDISSPEFKNKVLPIIGQIKNLATYIETEIKSAVSDSLSSAKSFKGGKAKTAQSKSASSKTSKSKAQMTSKASKTAVGARVKKAPKATIKSKAGDRSKSKSVKAKSVNSDKAVNLAAL